MFNIRRKRTYSLIRSFRDAAPITGGLVRPPGKFVEKASTSEWSDSSDACGQFVNRTSTAMFKHSPPVFDFLRGT